MRQFDCNAGRRNDHQMTYLQYALTFFTPSADSRLGTTLPYSTFFISLLFIPNRMSSGSPYGVPLSKVPSAVPPPGLSPNFVNPPTLHSTMVAVCSVISLLTLFFVITRLHLHLHTGHKFGLDDCDAFDSGLDRWETIC